MKKPYGWAGRILHIDLESGDCRAVPLDPELGRLFIGGKGLAGHFLRPFCTLNWDHPDMPLLLFTGPLNATISPTSGRAVLMSRSPLTGGMADSSMGGRMATQLKRAGYDGLVITGRAPEMCGIEIIDRETRIHADSALAGMTTSRVTDYAAARLDKAGSLMCVGPAAENGVLFSSVIVDKHHGAGRCGLGRTMAAKNLKYIHVRGTGKIQVHDLAALKAAREDILRLTAASPVLMGHYGFTCLGTGSLYDLMDNRRMMPTDNFRRTRFEKAASLNADTYRKKYKPKSYGCKGCHILCKKIGQDGRPMPEFETMSHFTALVGNMDTDLVLNANALCNDLGMDTISAASTLACHREITGRDLKPDEILNLLRDTAYARGDGRDLGLGAARYAEGKGMKDAAMAVKSLELPAYDPRGAYGMALAYALSTRGGCHLRAYPVSHEILRKPVATDRFSFSGKARIIKLAEDQNAVIDSLIACKFVFFAAGLEEYAKALTAVTGLEFSAQDLMDAGERVYYQERIMNHLCGFTAKDDDLPPRFFQEPGTSAPGLDIPPLDRQAFLEARSAYYRIRGLDQDGAPITAKAKQLGLEPSYDIDPDLQD